MKIIISRKRLELGFLFLILMASSHLLSAQGKFSATAGWGYYEQINVGAQWNFSKKCSFSLYGGTNFGLGDKTIWTAGFSFDQTFLKPIVWKLKPGYSIGILHWTSDDDLYHFENMAFPIMAILAYPVSESLSARIEGGPVFNFNTESERKQNVEAGYPKRFNGNIRLSVIYRFGTK